MAASFSVGDTVRVHLNYNAVNRLRQARWSVAKRERGEWRVEDRREVPRLTVQDASFVVEQSGVDRFEQQQAAGRSGKNVHSWIKGIVVPTTEERLEGDSWEPITYYPGRGYFSKVDGRTLDSCELVRFDEQGAWAQGAVPVRTGNPIDAVMLTGGELPTRDGVYQALGDDASYYGLMGLLESGKAQLLGKQWAWDGMEILTVQVGRAANPAWAISIGRRFLEAALNDYEDWEEKWWREAIQNAVDAGATEIELVATQNADGTMTIACDDNGKGMDLETLQNKFLVLGETGKTGDGTSVGGFGKAKEMLLLPWLSWSVVISGHRVVGNGLDGEFSVAPERKGVRLEVVMPADKCTSETYAKMFLSKCDLKGRKVTVNGEAFKEWLPAGQFLRNFGDDADVFVNRKGGISKVLVRVRGIYMFPRYLPNEVSQTVIVELKGNTLSLLTANRDGFRSGMGYQLDNLINEIAADTTSALRPKKKTFERKYRVRNRTSNDAIERVMAEAGNLFVSHPKAPGEAPIAGPGDQGNAPLSGQDVETMVSFARAAHTIISDVESEKDADNPFSLLPAESTLRTILTSLSYKGPEHKAATIKLLCWKPDLKINNRQSDKVPKGLRPETMTSTATRLLRVWTEACRYVMIQMNINKLFGVGFLFDNEVRAEYQFENNEHWLLLNPYGGGASEKLLAPNDEEDLGQIYALAIHEVTHLMGFGKYGHNDVFASALTTNMGVCTPGWPVFKRVVSAIKMRRESNPLDNEDKDYMDTDEAFDILSDTEASMDDVIRAAGSPSLPIEKVYQSLVQDEDGVAINLRDHDANMALLENPMLPIFISGEPYNGKDLVTFLLLTELEQRMEDIVLGPMSSINVMKKLVDPFIKNAKPFVETHDLAKFRDEYAKIWSKSLNYLEDDEFDLFIRDTFRGLSILESELGTPDDEQFIIFMAWAHAMAKLDLENKKIDLSGLKSLSILGLDDFGVPDEDA